MARKTIKKSHVSSTYFDDFPINHKLRLALRTIDIDITYTNIH